MESSILSEVDDTSILRTRSPRRYSRPLNWLPASRLLPRVAGWSAATLCHGASSSLQDAPAKVGSPPPNRTVQKSSRMCENASAIRDRRTLIRYRRQRRPRDSRLLERRTADVHEAPASIRFQDRPHIIVWRGARDEATLRGAKITIRPMISITGYARSAICLRLAKCRGFWVSRGTANSQRRMGRRDRISG